MLAKLRRTPATRFSESIPDTIDPNMIRSYQLDFGAAAP